MRALYHRRDGEGETLVIQNASEGLDGASAPCHADVRVKFFKGLYHEVVSEKAQQVSDRPSSEWSLCNRP